MFYKEIPVCQIKLLPQPELPPLPSLLPSELNELRKSIETFGILQPLLVTMDGNDGYTLHSGHNRLSIAKELGLDVVPCCILIKKDCITDRLMGYDTDMCRRHLTPAQKNELLMWLSGLKLIKRPSSTSENSPSTDKTMRDQTLKKMKEDYEIRITELEEKGKKKDVEIKDLREAYNKAIDDIEEARFRQSLETPTDDEKIRKLQQDVDDAKNRANKISIELESARSEHEKTKDALRKERNKLRATIAGINATLWHQRRENQARDKLQLGENLLTKTQKVLEEVADIVRRDKVSVKTDSFHNLLGQINKAVSSIPFYESRDGKYDDGIDNGDETEILDQVGVSADN
jgi:hypothetical protein